MKKGQIEIMGLVIIVILLVFIAIFALSFMIKPKQESEDILKLKANALRASLLKTNLCGNVNVKYIITNGKKSMAIYAHKKHKTSETPKKSKHL